MRIAKGLQIMVGVLILTGAPVAAMAEQGPQVAAKQQIDDASYVAMVAAGDRFQIEAGRLALQRSTDEDVVNFARVMLGVYGRFSAKLAAAAQDAALPVPTDLNDRCSAMLQQLRDAKTQAEFDRAYVAAQVEMHNEALGLHRTYAGNGGHKALKQVATEAIPYAQVHLDRLAAMKK